MRLGILRKASRAAIKERRWPASRSPECKQPDGNHKGSQGSRVVHQRQTPRCKPGGTVREHVYPPPVFPCVAQRAAGPREAVR